MGISWIATVLCFTMFHQFQAKFAGYTTKLEHQQILNALRLDFASVLLCLCHGLSLSLFIQRSELLVRSDYATIDVAERIAENMKASTSFASTCPSPRFLHLFLHLFPWFPLFSTVFHRFPMFFNGFQCFPMFSNVFQCFPGVLWIRDILGQTTDWDSAVCLEILEVLSTRFDDYTRTAKLEQQLQAPLWTSYNISFAIVI